MSLFSESLSNSSFEEILTFITNKHSMIAVSTSTLLKDLTFSSQPNSLDFPTSPENPEKNSIKIEWLDSETQTMSKTPSSEDSRLQQQIWIESHDNILLKLVKDYRYDWKKIEARIKKMTGLKKSTSFLQKRFKTLKGKISKKFALEFSPEEDSLLVQGVKLYGYDWAQISQTLPERDASSVKNRFYHMKRNGKIDSE